MSEGDREGRLRELFDRAVDLPLAERDQLIAGIDDEVLAERLRALLLQDLQGTAGLLQRSAAEGLQSLRRIGRYELLRELGRGGMGTVLLARQLEPVERLVALKIVHGGDSTEVAQRFSTERQTLALMNHPGIARIFDGGTTDDGVPYFVMEYVRGEPITAYCDRRQLDCEARVALFVKVCEAVQHAHQKAVLHRDLKPGNVLVTEEGGAPQPKVIDFGVARALSGGVGPQQQTSGGVLVGTFVYMSPEQADRGGQDVDTRADVYSLGVMLYELLTGELPLDLDLDKIGYLGFQRALLETSPPRASARVAALPAEQQAQRARSRGVEPTALCRHLQGDLDWILLRALEKDRNKRYASATELAADLLRHQHNEAVAAGPPSLRYRLTKYVARHRVAVASGVLIALAFTVGIIGTTRGMLLAQSARDAEAAARRQQSRQLLRQRAVGDFFEFLLFYGDPGTGRQPPSLRELLDGLTPIISQRFAGRSLEAAAVHAGVGRAYLALGESSSAARQLRTAWSLMAASADEDAAEACLLLCDLAQARGLAGEPAHGREELVEMVRLAELALAGEPQLVAAVHRLSVLLQPPGQSLAQLPARCAALLELLVAFERDGGSARDRQVERLTGRLLAEFGTYMQEAQLAGSEQFLQRLEDVARPGLGADVDFLQLLGRFAERQLRNGRLDDARRLAAEVLAGLARLDFRDHWLQLRAERVRGLALALGGEPATGETILVELHRRLWDLPSAANQQARAAANALVELSASLAAKGELDAFLAASLSRWQEIVARDPACPPWWPADVDALPLSTTTAARAVAQRAFDRAASPGLQALLGGLLLREDRADAAVAALEQALAAAPAPTPELLGDLGLARMRTGDEAGAASAIGALRALAERDGVIAARCQRALARAAAAGLR